MSSFFSYFPTVDFENRLLTDLSLRIKIRNTWLNDDRLYYNYNYQDHDKPEHIAKKYYGDESLHWIILLTNNIFDHTFDFPMSESIFKQYIADKYNNKNGVKTVRINSGGSGYVNGIYQDVPLNVSNPTSLSTIGTEIKVNITVSSNTVSNISVFRGGTNYDSNTTFSVSNTYLGGTGSGFVGSVINYMDGYTYALNNLDPIYRYQKRVSIYSRSNQFTPTQDNYYVVDADTYANLYEDSNPSRSNITTGDGEQLTYIVSRRYPEVTYFDREYEINESKRLIRILKKDYISQARQEILNLI